jgi:hypothetical protein
MRYRIIVPCMCAALCCFSLPGQAFAACATVHNYEQEGGLSGWPARVEESSDATLRTAYTQGTCNYLKGEHGGGTVPAGAASDRHVTVLRGSVTCHVFKKLSTSTAEYFPTTCF